MLKEIRRIVHRLLGSEGLAQTAQAVCPDDAQATWETVYEAMCFDFTAYTHLRRLMILRFLDRQDSADLARICSEIGMSPMAARRQTDKLIRRGILRKGRDGRMTVVCICRERSTWLRTRLLTCVLSSLRQGLN